MAKETNQAGTPKAAAPAAKKTIDPEKAKVIEAKKVARNDARKRIIDFVGANREELKGLADDILRFVGKGPRAAGAPRSSINTDLRQAFLDAGTKGLTEMDIFKRFKIGRPEMVTKIRILVLCPNPADRVWVEFDEAKETYFVVGQGQNPPAGWDGYIPGQKEKL